MCNSFTIVFLLYTTQHAAFGKWLRTRQLRRKADGVASITPVRLELDWHDHSNPNDCAIYTMRHMETYEGAGLAGWTAGFNSGRSADALKNLRIKYLSQILYSKINVRKDKIAAAVRTFSKS